MELRTAARVAFIELQNDDLLRRSLLSKTSATPLVYRPGDQAFYYRKVRPSDYAQNLVLSDDVWRETAQIIGAEGNSYWVSHHSSLLKISAEQLRPAVDEEVWSPLEKDREGLEALAKHLGEDQHIPFEDLRGYKVPVAADWKHMELNELQELCEKKGLDKTGDIEDLPHRLRIHVVEEAEFHQYRKRRELNVTGWRTPRRFVSYPASALAISLPSASALKTQTLRRRRQ